MLLVRWMAYCVAWCAKLGIVPLVGVHAWSTWVVASYILHGRVYTLGKDGARAFYLTIGNEITLKCQPTEHLKQNETPTTGCLPYFSCTTYDSPFKAETLSVPIRNPHFHPLLMNKCFPPSLCLGPPCSFYSPLLHNILHHNSILAM